MQNRPRRLGVPFFQIPTSPTCIMSHTPTLWIGRELAHGGSRLMSDGARAVARVWTAEENFADFELRNGCNRQI